LVWKKRSHSLSGEEILRAEDADVVDEDVDIRIRGDQLRAPFRRGEVAREARSGSLLAAQPLLRGIDALLAAAIDDHVRAGRNEALGGGEADARGGTGHQHRAACEMDMHSEFS
jgi:hypothetical protein